MAELTGFGSIYERPGSSRLWIAYYHEGKQYRESCGSDDRKKAERLLKRRTKETGLGRPVQASKNVTLRALRRLHEADSNSKGNTSGKEIARAWGHLENFFGEGAKATAITAIRLEEYVKHRDGEGVKPSTIRNELAAIKRAFNLARKKEVLLGSEVPAFPTVTVRNQKRGFFSEQEMEAIKAHLPADVADAIEFFYVIGWRSSEVTGLQWSQVELGAQSIRIEETKNKEPRTLPYGALPQLVTLIEKRRRISDETQKRRGLIVTHVFSRDGEPIKSFRTTWITACIAAGLGQVVRNEAGRVVRIALKTPHDFRRTAARNLLRAGVPEKTIMAVCGWKSRSVFDRYSVIDEVMIAEGLAKLAKAQAAPAQSSVVSIAAGRRRAPRA